MYVYMQKIERKKEKLMKNQFPSPFSLYSFSFDFHSLPYVLYPCTGTKRTNKQTNKQTILTSLRIYHAYVQVCEIPHPGSGLFGKCGEIHTYICSSIRSTPQIFILFIRLFGRSVLSDGGCVLGKEELIGLYGVHIQHSDFYRVLWLSSYPPLPLPPRGLIARCSQLGARCSLAVVIPSPLHWPSLPPLGGFSLLSSPKKEYSTLIHFYIPAPASAPAPQTSPIANFHSIESGSGPDWLLLVCLIFTRLIRYQNRGEGPGGGRKLRIEKWMWMWMEW